MNKVSFYLALWPDETGTIVMTDNSHGRDLWSCLDEIGEPEAAKVFLMQADYFFGNPMDIKLIPVDPVGPWQKPRLKRNRKRATN